MFRIYIIPALALATVVAADVISVSKEQNHATEFSPHQDISIVAGSKTELNTPPSLELKISTVPAKYGDSGSEVELTDDQKPRSLLQPPEPAVRTEDINGLESAFRLTQQTGFPNPGFRNNLPRPERGVAAQIFNRHSRGSARHISKPKDYNQQDLTKNHDSTNYKGRDEIDKNLKPTITLNGNTPNPVKRQMNSHEESKIYPSNIDYRNEPESKRFAIIKTSIPFSLKENQEFNLGESKKITPVAIKQGRQLWTYFETIPFKLYNIYPTFYTLQESVQISHPLQTFPPTVMDFVDNSIPLNTISLKSVGDSAPFNTVSLQSVGNSVPLSTLSLQSLGDSDPPSTVAVQSVGNSFPSSTVSLKSSSNSIPLNTVTLQSVGDSVPLNSVSINSVPLNTVSPPSSNSIPLHAVPLMTDLNIQHQSDDKMGNYEYGYSNRLSAKYESRSLDGVTRGAYSYLDPYGAVQSVNYEADNLNGFRVMATNLPLAPKL